VRLRRGGAVAAVAAVAFAMAVGCAAPEPPSAGFVRRSGDALTLNGQPWRFVGLNAYNLNSRGDCWYAMAGTDGLAEAVRASGSTVLRAWFLQSLAVAPHSGPDARIDWSVFDDTLARARAAGVRVVVTLADHWNACEPPRDVPKSAAWYESEYRTVRQGGWPDAIDVLPLTYRDYVAAIVTRYRDDPTILSWQPVNEPEVCGPDGAQTLRNFTQDVTSLIKGIDPNHLVSLGTIGGGQCGTVEDDYRSLHALPDVDWCEIHDYSGPSGTTLPGDQWNGSAVRFQQCAALGKPVVVGEAGIRLDEVEGGTTAARAAAFDQKMTTYRTAGASGFLVWNWADAAHPCDRPYCIIPGDPTLAVIADQARQWTQPGP
jgi:mannan endo-1,4-beta-mannosidase